MKDHFNEQMYTTILEFHLKIITKIKHWNRRFLHLLPYPVGVKKTIKTSKTLSVQFHNFMILSLCGFLNVVSTFFLLLNFTITKQRSIQMKLRVDNVFKRTLALLVKTDEPNLR